MLGTWGFMMGREVEAIPVFLGSYHHSALGCFPMASPAHDCQGGDGICAPCQPNPKWEAHGSEHNADAPTGTGSGVWGCLWVLQNSLRSVGKRKLYSLDGKVCGKGKGEQE